MDDLAGEVLAEYQNRCRQQAAAAADGAGFAAFALMRILSGAHDPDESQWVTAFGETVEDIAGDPQGIARRLTARFHRAQFEAAIREVGRRRGAVTLLRARLWRAKRRLALEKQAAAWLAGEMPTAAAPLAAALQS